MPPCTLDKNMIEAAVRFHGHWCPGLALGIRAAELALDKVGPDGDEDVVALVETDMCGVDAIQFFTGCTFGKGNLIHLDHGKAVFTFIRRSDNEAWRISARENRPDPGGEELRGLMKRRTRNQPMSPEENKRADELKAATAGAIMDADLNDLFKARKVETIPPAKARIHGSITCAQCGERTMETKARLANNQLLCIPCFQTATSRGGGVD